jgi:hypothetical protein
MTKRPIVSLWNKVKFHVTAIAAEGLIVGACLAGAAIENIPGLTDPNLNFTAAAILVAAVGIGAIVYSKNKIRGALGKSWNKVKGDLLSVAFGSSLSGGAACTFYEGIKPPLDLYLKYGKTIPDLTGVVFGFAAAMACAAFCCALCARSDAKAMRATLEAGPR